MVKRNVLNHYQSLVFPDFFLVLVLVTRTLRNLLFSVVYSRCSVGCLRCPRPLKFSNQASPQISDRVSEKSHETYIDVFSIEVSCFNDNRKRRDSMFSESSTMTVKCWPERKILFLKTHKTNSSTMANIFFRYGDSRNLTPKWVFAVRMAKEIPSRFCDSSKHQSTEHFVQSDEV